MKLLLFIFKRKSEDTARNSSKLEVKASFLPFEPKMKGLSSSNYKTKMVRCQILHKIQSLDETSIFNLKVKNKKTAENCSMVGKNQVFCHFDPFRGV